MVTLPTLNLVCESKICDLMTCQEPAGRWEASGVLLKDGYCFVVFDNRAEIGRFKDDLQHQGANGLFRVPRPEYEYDGISYNAVKRWFYLLIEARKHARECYQASIVEYDDEFKFLKERTVDFTFESGNTGFEAV